LDRRLKDSRSSDRKKNNGREEIGRGIEKKKEPGTYGGGAV